MFIDLPYSKKRKCLERIGKYWKQKAQAYEERSDEGAETDSQDEQEHSVWPTDTNVLTYQKKWT